MTAPLSVVAAPNFHLPDAPEGRVLVADGAGWRALAAAEQPAAPLHNPVLLFVLPQHLRASFWVLLEQAETGASFDAFAAAVGQFLTFKELPPPERAVFELVLHGAGGRVEPRGLWAIINMGDEPVAVGVPGLRVRLGAGEGLRLPDGVAVEVLPVEGEAPAVLLVVRKGTGGA